MLSPIRFASVLALCVPLPTLFAASTPPSQVLNASSTVSRQMGVQNAQESNSRRVGIAGPAIREPFVFSFHLGVVPAAR